MEKLKAELGEAHVSIQSLKERIKQLEESNDCFMRSSELANAEADEHKIEAVRFRALFEEQKLEREGAETNLDTATQLISRWIARLPDRTIGGHLADLLRDSLEFLRNQPASRWTHKEQPTAPPDTHPTTIPVSDQ